MIQSLGAPQVASLTQVRQCVVVVEDEFLIRMMLSEQLRDEGYDVVEACNADEALIAMETTVPDLIIRDVRMPGALDGLGLLAVVRQTHPMLPIIITSGHLQPTLATSAGATQFVAKPYSFEVIVEAAKDRLAMATAKRRCFTVVS